MQLQFLKIKIEEDINKYNSNIKYPHSFIEFVFSLILSKESFALAVFEIKKFYSESNKLFKYLEEKKILINFLPLFYQIFES